MVVVSLGDDLFLPTPRPKLKERNRKMSETKKAHYSGGRVFPHKKSRYWFAAWYTNGVEHRKSTGVEYSKTDPAKGKGKAGQALERLKKEYKEAVAAGPPPFTYLELRQLLIDDYSDGKHRSLASLEGGPLTNLDRHFEAMTIDDLTTDAVDAYVKKRKAEGAAHATRNNELAALRRMLHLGIKKKKIKAEQIPDITITQPDNAREGFVELPGFLKIVTELPEHIKPLAMFLFASSWRSGEAKKLVWSDVDFDAGTVTLKAAHSKNKKARVFPFAQIGLARDAIEMAKARRGNRSATAPVFCNHLNLGRPIGDFRKSWKPACKRAGLPGVLVHDLRRSAVRNMIAAGLSEADAMAISGHKTRDIFQRYNIKTLDNLRDSAALLGKFLDAPKSGKSAETDVPQGADRSAKVPLAEQAGQ
jgi:integrase